MKKVLSIVVMCAFVFGAFTAQAEEYCEYDAVGTTQFAPTIQILPDGEVAFAVAAWWEDDVYACYNAFQNPAYLFYFPRCDQDGNGLVEIQWLLDMYYFVLNFGPSAKAPYSAPCVNGCYDMASVNFGAPAMPLGAALIDGTCSTIFGSAVPNGITIYANVADCDAACGGGCDTNADCAAGEYCKFEDYTCGPAGAGTCEAFGEVCAAIYDPVCSCDFQIVSSACQATIVGASIMADGECSQEDVCNNNGGTWNGTDCDCPAGYAYNYQRGCELE